MTTRKFLAVILVLQVLILMNQWLGSPVSTARAQIPDAGAQQQKVIDELKSSNEKLDKMISILDSGKLQVVVSKSDDNGKK
jgi:cell division protein FtsB